MRRSLAIAWNFASSRLRGPAATFLFSLMMDIAPFQANALPAGTLQAAPCDVEYSFVHGVNRVSDSDMPSPVRLLPPDELTQARAYLIETADPGYTMSRQGPALAIERLHPEFATRLAGALREAR